jgi:hypothetical protein
MRHYIPILLGLFAIADPARAGDDLGKALKAVTTADSYAFSVNEGTAKSAVEAKYQKEVPLYYKADKVEFFRKGDVLIYNEKDAWQRTRTGTVSDPLRILGPSAKVRAIRLPHEELAILGKGLVKLKKADGGFSGDFDVDTARKLARTEDRDLARGGTAKLWLEGGKLAKYEIAIRVQGRRGNAEVNGVVSRTVIVSGVGMTKVELPEGAKKALE